MIYHYPSLSNHDLLLFRLHGAGLANHLFPMYRAFQKSRQTNGVFLFPPMIQIKLGTIIRREQDKRIYSNLFQRRSINELIKLKILVSSNKFNESNYELLDKTKDGVIIYEGIEDHSSNKEYYFFKFFNNEFKEDFVNMLMEKTKNKARLSSELSTISKDDICVHIRRGDFPDKLSDEWYIKSINYVIQEFPGRKIRIFTDDINSLGDNILSIKNITVDSSYNAWHGLIKMSAHGTIVASKSTFALWSAFIGNQKIISNSQSDLSRFVNNKIQII